MTIIVAKWTEITDDHFFLPKNGQKDMDTIDNQKKKGTLTNLKSWRFKR